MPSWKLENAVKIQKEAPYTFYRPSEIIIDQLKAGEATVKLIFKFDSDESDVPSAERMWVIIDAINEDGTFVGTLDNDPFHIKDLKAGDQIIFRREHIIQYDTLDELEIEDENEDNLEPYLKRCIVSNQIIKDNMPIGYIYREPPSEERDLGWHIMTGKETKEYLDDDNNFQYIAIGVVLNKDDGFIHLLNEPVGSEFRRDEITGTFFSIN